jgi:hypothetical protein
VGAGAAVQRIRSAGSERRRGGDGTGLALLNRSGTGFFLVFNDRRDTSPFTADELLGRSFIAKYTRMFDY